MSVHPPLQGLEIEDKCSLFILPCKDYRTRMSIHPPLPKLQNADDGVRLVKGLEEVEEWFGGRVGIGWGDCGDLMGRWWGEGGEKVGREWGENE